VRQEAGDPERSNDMQQRRYLKPSWLISRVANPLLMWFGAVPTLQVQGRKTGRWRSVPVNILELDRERYLVAPRGETDWVRNLRAAGGGQLRYGRRTVPFTAAEVPDKEKPRVIEAYLERWGRQVRSQFEALPDPADHPVFRIEPGQV
jgi:deazaflavin-dependent oxidoreductase (nitroreductase family)